MAIRKSIGNKRGGTCLLLCCLVLVFSLVFAYVFSFICLAVNMNSAKNEIRRCLDSYTAEVCITNFDYLKNHVDSISGFSPDDFLERLGENSRFTPTSDGFVFRDLSGNTVFYLSDFSIVESYRDCMIYSVNYSVKGRFRLSSDFSVPYSLNANVISDYISK